MVALQVIGSSCILYIIQRQNRQDCLTGRDCIWNLRDREGSGMTLFTLITERILVLLSLPFCLSHIWGLTQNDHLSSQNWISKKFINEESASK